MLNLFPRLPPGRVCVSRFSFALCFTLACAEVVSPAAPGRVSCFAFRVSRDVSLWHLWRHLLFVSRCAYFRISYHNGVVERAIELLCVSRLTLWHLLLSCFAFRVSRYVSLWHLWQFFLVTRMCFSFHFGILTMIRSCTWIFSRWCARCCARMVAAQDAVQDGVQDFMQDDRRA